jgi:hypothetical protein
MRKNHTFHRRQHKLVAPEVINESALIVGHIIKNKIAEGMSLQKASKETFEELNLINKVVQKLALHYVNSSKLISPNPESLNSNYKSLRFIM